MKRKQNAQIHESINKQSFNFFKARKKETRYIGIIILIIGIGLIVVNTHAASRIGVRFSLSNTSTDAGIAFSEPSSTVVPVGVSGNWSLKFSDEFNGTTLDATKWTPSWLGSSTGFSNPINTDEDACFHSDQAKVTNGSLSLTTTENTDANCKLRNGATAPYKAGIVTTYKKYTTTYGYFESKIYLPGAGGKIYNWPAFWTDGAALNWPTTGEIDIMEALSDHIPNWHYHYSKNGAEAKPGGAVNMDGTGWHTYGAHWEPGKVTWYYDGKEVGSWTDGIVNVDHFIILNYAMNDRYGYNPNNSMLVDYVRVWQ